MDESHVRTVIKNYLSDALGPVDLVVPDGSGQLFTIRRDNATDIRAWISDDVAAVLMNVPGRLANDDWVCTMFQNRGNLAKLQNQQRGMILRIYDLEGVSSEESEP